MHEGESYRCLVTEGCNARPIRAHSVPRAILADIQSDGHVMRPSTKLIGSHTGFPQRTLQFRPVGIRRASTGNFACELHDANFKAVDSETMDFHDSKVLDLLFYRAILLELWQLLRTQRAITWIESRMRLPGPLPSHPVKRQIALFDAAARLRPYVVVETSDNRRPPTVHIVRRLKTERPIVAASCAGGGSDVAVDRATGGELSLTEIRSLTGREPNASWGLTIIPRRHEHIVVASWLKGSLAQDYVRHLVDTDGRELQAAVSAELIHFCENWFLHPAIWDAYGTKKQQAILKAYDNLMDLQLGKYTWLARGTKPWYDYLGIPNRHQLNLFSYGQIPIP